MVKLIVQKMTEQEKLQDKLNKEQQVKRLMGFLDPVAKRFIADLELLYSIKKEQARVLNERIKERSDQLRYQVLMFLYGKIHSASQDDLRKISGIYWTENQKDYELLPFIVENSFGFGLDADGQSYAKAGSGLVTRIEMKGLISSGVCLSFEDLAELLKRISGYWDGIANITCSPHSPTKEEIIIEFNIAGLIHENAGPLKS